MRLIKKILFMDFRENFILAGFERQEHFEIGVDTKKGFLDNLTL